MKKIAAHFTGKKNIFPISCRYPVNNVFSWGRLQSNNYCSKSSGIVENLNISTTAEKRKRMDFKTGPGLSDFISASKEINNSIPPTTDDSIPYLDNNLIYFREQRVFFDVYGCQMNVNDTEIVWSILKSNNYTKTNTREEADVILVMTCAIREGAESKIWSHLNHLRGLKKRQAKLNHHVKIGILGCMAERLKHKLLEKEQAVDIVAGPDSYKDLPRLLAITENNQTAVNVLLSLDETYADIIPVRLNSNSKSAFVSIMRGCDNMCTYCIVPFTRGRERSRPLDSIVNEIKQLSVEGVKEVTLLGQNVNSYRYLSEANSPQEATKQVKGFKTVYKVKTGGLRFADLLDKVSAVDPEMRIRFTSPHPKDFPDELLQLVKERSNICKSLHLPVQSGNSAVLERMRRGYTREAYLDLIEHVRDVIPNVGLSSDFICGFCHETDEEFNDTLTLMEKVKYNVAYLFAYSMREKTTAHRRYQDDVPYEVKQDRLVKMIEVYRRGAEELNAAQIGEVQNILVEGKSKKSGNMLFGRNDANLKVLIPAGEILSSHSDCLAREISAGDYIAVKIHSSNSQILKGTPLFHTSLSSFDKSISVVEVSKLKLVV